MIPSRADLEATGLDQDYIDSLYRRALQPTFGLLDVQGDSTDLANARAALATIADLCHATKPADDESPSPAARRLSKVLATVRRLATVVLTAQGVPVNGK